MRDCVALLGQLLLLGVVLRPLALSQDGAVLGGLITDLGALTVNQENNVFRFSGLFSKSRLKFIACLWSHEYTGLLYHLSTASYCSSGLLRENRTAVGGRLTGLSNTHLRGLISSILLHEAWIGLGRWQFKFAWSTFKHVLIRLKGLI